MYLLFKSVSQRDLGIVQPVGRWASFIIGYVPDTHKDVFDFRQFRPRILEEEVAYSYMFLSAYRNFINVKPETPQNDRLQLLSSEESIGAKAKYYLTDQDKANVVSLFKEIMRYTLDEVYDKRLIELKLNVSEIELQSWDQQRQEAIAYANDASASTPMLSVLATSRGITVAEMVAKVQSAIDKYNADLANLLGKKQAIENEIKLCASMADCHRLMHNRFEVNMSQQQREEENVTTEAKFDI